MFEVVGEQYGVEDAMDRCWNAQLLAQVYVELTGGRQIGLALVTEPSPQASSDLAALKVAWSLTAGKKKRLGEELFSKLELIKDARKASVLKVA